MAPLAIIGFAARYAQDARDAEQFWDFLLRARQSTTPIPEDRFNADAFYHPDPEHGGTFNVKGAHFLGETPLAFDAGFFSISKTEVLTLDPAQRLVMENVYHALENAGIPMEKAISSNTSVFAGAFNLDHLTLLNSDVETTFKHLTTGSQESILSNRVSWFYDFQGPSVLVNTACSSGLVAVHLAAQSLKSGDCEMAVVTGGCVLSHVADIIAFGHAGFLSPSGKCFTFDSRAEGYARGEGVGTIIIKNLSNALRDGDTIRAIIHETGSNQDGRTPGITLPSVTAQARLIREVYKRASLDPKDTLFVEAHGTGTAAGDPIEAEAIASAFASDSRRQPLYIGALKASIGHLEGGAGIAGIIKSIMILESGIIPPNVNYKKVNPNIPKEEWNIDFPTECIPWPESGARRVSVNSFGFGGTNGHCILGDAYHFLKENGLLGNHNTRVPVPTQQEIPKLLSPAKAFLTNGHCNGETSAESAIPRLFVLSAFDKDGIQRTASDLKHYLAPSRSSPSEVADELLSDLAYTLSEKRTTFQWKSYGLATSIPELEENLSAARPLPKPTGTGDMLRLGFVFTGQGAQYPGMAKELLVYPVFRKSLEEATAYVRKLGNPTSLIDELLNEQDTTRIHTPAISQPTCTAVQVAFVELLATWNIYPRRVIGHSSGEIAAAYCAGKISREAAWAVAYYRGQVLSKPKSAKGAMMAVGLDAESLRPYMEKVRATNQGELIIACFNSPTNNTVSGDAAMIDSLERLLDADSVFTRKLKVQDAYHSALMKPLSAGYLELMGELTMGEIPPNGHGCPMFSTVTGKEVKHSSLGASYWVDNMLSPVLFTGALRSMLTEASENDPEVRRSDKARVDEVIEVGPHSTLQSAIKETSAAASASEISISYTSLLSRYDRSIRTTLNAVGALYAKGCPVNVYAVNQSRDKEERPPKLLVDLPHYSFNHSEKGYYESRLSKNLRFRKFPRHQLLGAPVQDWDRQNRKWRHFLRHSENPWLRDHMVSGRCVFPEAGYLTMVTEAARQVTGDVVEVTGLRFKDVSIHAALVVPDTKEGVEVSMSLLPVNESNLWQSTVWKWFRIASYNPDYDDWVEHCSGYMSLEYTTPPDPVTRDREHAAETQDWKTVMDQGAQACQTPLDARGVYDNLGTIGLEYGTVFRNLSNVAVSGMGKGMTAGVARTPDLTDIMPKGYIHPHLIHPITLDSMFLAGLVAIPDHEGRSSLRLPVAPTFIKEAWISAKTDSQAGATFRYQGRAAPETYNAYNFDLNCVDSSTGQPRVSLAGVRFTPLSRETAGPSDTDNVGYTLDWIPDINMLRTSEFRDLTWAEPSESYEVQRDAFENLQLASTLLITDALSALENLPAGSFKGHMLKYYEWMKEIVKNLITDSVLQVNLDTWRKYSQDPKLKEELYKVVAQTDVEGELLIRLGSNIAAVMEDKIDPLYLMFGQDDLMPRYYQYILHQGDSAEILDRFLSLMADNSDSLEILEIGAGTGALTTHILSALADKSESNSGSTDSADKIAQYTFTDISPGFFSKAEEALKPWKEKLTFQKLDISVDPTTQGFSTAKYDVIVASNVLHATPDMEKTLANCRSLLKPGGKLLINEGTKPELLWPSLIFGLLPGWWLSTESIRTWCPLMNMSQWATLLQRTGFSGVDLDIPNSRYPEFAKLTTIVSTAVQDYERRGVDDVLILCHAPGVEHGVGSEITAELKQNLGITKCTLLQPRELQGRDLTNSICISLFELENPILPDIGEDDFINIRNLLSTCKRLVWVSGDSAAEPLFSVGPGMIRTVRWERDGESPNIITLEATGWNSSLTRQLVDSILKIFHYEFMTGQSRHRNAEYLVRDGLTYTSRVIPHPKATNFLWSRFSTPAPEMTRWQDAGRPIKLQNSVPGVLNKLQWVTDTATTAPLGDSEVEIDPRAVGLNFEDLSAVMGEAAAEAIGREAAGIITRVGAGVKQFQTGDRVVYLADSVRKGTFQTNGRTDEKLAAKIPDDMSFADAAGLAVIYATAIYSLSHVGRLIAGERVLIHSAAGGVGQAAVQCAKEIGAEVFVTVSTAEKMEFLKREYDIPEDHIFSSRDSSFVKGVMRMTHNSGVDLVLNSLSREALRQSWECVAPFGRFIEIGKKDSRAGGKLDMTHFLRNTTFAGVDLFSLAESKPAVIRGLLDETIRLWTAKKIKGANPTKVLKYPQLEEGLRMLQSGTNIGKIVYVPDENATVPVIPETQTPYTFKHDASYVLAGGLGGLGRSLAHWMADRGAKHLVFLSRTGNITKPVEDMVSSLENEGCVVRIIKCDVTDAASLRLVFEECSQTLPPIRGCIQCSMVLKDGVFETMSHADWGVPLKPKVQGSLNLHECLPEDLDFFLMLSSVGGIMGSRSQANYCAGNTYQDALVKYRVAKGLPASSFVLGPILSVGFVAENRDYARYATKTIVPMRVDEFHTIVEYLIDPRHSLTEGTCQAIFGLAGRRWFEERGFPVPEPVNYPMFSLFQSMGSSQQQGSQKRDTYNIHALLMSAGSREEAADIVLKGVIEKLSSLLSVSADEVDLTKSIRMNGIDSLIAMEFRVWLAKEVGAEIPLLDLMVGDNITAMADKVTSMSKYVQGNEMPPPN